jgi:hypothetical protein
MLQILKIRSAQQSNNVDALILLRLHECPLGNLFLPVFEWLWVGKHLWYRPVVISFSPLLNAGWSKLDVPSNYVNLHLRA